MEKLLLWYILDFSILLDRTPAFHVVRLGSPLALEDGTSATTANWGVAGMAEEVSRHLCLWWPFREGSLRWADREVLAS